MNRSAFGLREAPVIDLTGDDSDSQSNHATAPDPPRQRPGLSSSLLQLPREPSPLGAPAAIGPGRTFSSAVSRQSGSRDRLSPQSERPRETLTGTSSVPNTDHARQGPLSSLQRVSIGALLSAPVEELVPSISTFVPPSNEAAVVPPRADPEMARGRSGGGSKAASQTPTPQKPAQHPSQQSPQQESDRTSPQVPRPPLLQPLSSGPSPPQVADPSSAQASMRESARNTPMVSVPNSSKFTPKPTPVKIDWTVDKLARELKVFSREIGKNHEELCHYTLVTARPAREFRVQTGDDWFSGLKADPVPEEKDVTLRAKFKQHIRGKKDQREMHFRVTCLKTNATRVPKYRFHHVQINRNILTPDTMLKFFPHIRDLEPDQVEPYNRWLSELEEMDGQCGFKTLTQEQKAAKIIKDENVAQLSLFLGSWLKRLSLDGLNQATLVQYLASRKPDEAVTPRQKTATKEAGKEATDDNAVGSPRAFKAAKLFTEAFDRAFKNWVKDQVVTLGNVLLDPTVEDIHSTKKVAKDSIKDGANDGPGEGLEDGANGDAHDGTNDDESQAQPQATDPLKEAESHLETYCVFGCLICFSHSCEHGEWDREVKHERLAFSVDVQGRLSGLLRRRRELAASKLQDRDGSTDKTPDPCKRDCFRVNGASPRFGRYQPEPWTDEELRTLKTLVVTSAGSKVKMWPQCTAAQLLGRQCWDVHRQFMDHKLNSLLSPPREQVLLPKVKGVYWYDRFEKCLIGDWQDITDTHEFQRRGLVEACKHEGPCSAANGCPCFAAKVLCERFCACNVETCPIKFTGCACRSNGRTCLVKQRGEKPCICAQLSRECDPVLCGSCGAMARADPHNAHEDTLHSTGCQNVNLQRGAQKKVLVGESQLPGVGYGLFTTEDISREEFVIEYVGELISHDEGVRREARRGADLFDETSHSSYLFTLLEYEGIWVDAAIYGNMSRYINHCTGEKRSCNVTPRIMYVNGEYRIQFTALRDIRAGEELFFDYGENFPNLTQKLLDDKVDQEAGADVAGGATKRRRRRRGEAAAEKAAQKVTAKKGVRANGGATGKAFKPKGARKEAPATSAGGGNRESVTTASLELAELEDEAETAARSEQDAEPGPELEVPPRMFKSRKRKRVDEDEDEDEYQPGKTDTPTSDHSDFDGRRGPRPGSARRKRAARRAFEARQNNPGTAADDNVRPDSADKAGIPSRKSASPNEPSPGRRQDSNGMPPAGRSNPVTPVVRKRPRANARFSDGPVEEYQLEHDQDGDVPMEDAGEVMDPTPTKSRKRSTSRARAALALARQRARERKARVTIPDSDLDSEAELEAEARPAAVLQQRARGRGKTREDDDSGAGEEAGGKDGSDDDEETRNIAAAEDDDEGIDEDSNLAIRRSGRKRRPSKYRATGRPDVQ